MKSSSKSQRQAEWTGPQPVAALQGVQAYRRQEKPAEVSLHLDGNEGAAPEPGLWQRVGSRLTSDELRSYPSSVRLETKIAASFGLTPEQVFVTAGGDEALDRCFRAFLEPGREFLCPVPSFEMLRIYARLAGGRVRPIPWFRGGFPTEEILASATQATALVALVSPNNPTGLEASPEDLLKISRALPQALILVDQAYAEFGTQDLTEPALTLENAVVVRSFSKAWGLAGLRVGYALGPKHLIDILRAAGSPYNVASASLALAEAWWEQGTAELPQRVERVRYEREQLAMLLRQKGAEVWPSQANFVFARLTEANSLTRHLEKQGIAIRCFSKQTELQDCIRISCPVHEEGLSRLLAAIRTWNPSLSEGKVTR
ncbi:MAG: histidinol-phosphate aminotransferase family protein [Planctomycetota bacterium]|nr:MAG: histidinol-phosphate aminotransferase family protein [Planctomycetota bacterium]